MKAELPSFHIEPPDRAIDSLLQEKIDRKTKPVGALGRLEEIALRIGRIQQSLSPELRLPHIVVFAADHGISGEGVSAYPRDVTWQMLLNFLNGGAAINVFTKQHGIDLILVDAGVDHDFGDVDDPHFIHAKIGPGTRNCLEQPAMSEQECADAINKGAEIVGHIHQKGSNIIGFGEMGIGNSSSASLLMSSLLQIPVEVCVGRGTGINDKTLVHKNDLLGKVLNKARGLKTAPKHPFEWLQLVGGFEIAMMCGAMLKAAELKMTVLVDGFISSSAFLCACKAYPAVTEYAFFCHTSDEKGHRRLLQEMNQKPILDLGMRLGEGTGCAVAYPIIQSAVGFLDKMASFDDAAVTKRDET